LSDGANRIEDDHRLAALESKGVKRAALLPPTFSSAGIRQGFYRHPHKPQNINHQRKAQPFNPAMSKNISQVWTFSSDSNPSVSYQTLRYVDGTTSCNCKGWTRRVALDGTRSCKHTRFVDMGLADQNCTATHNYQQPQTPQPERKQTHAKNNIHQILPLGHRKIAV
jgi:hypothetical protein